MENTKVIEIIKIKNPTKFFKQNLHSLYILNSFGLRYFEEEDEIGNQIKNLKALDFMLNVNETLIFRTFLNNQIIIYELLENRLHIIKTSLNIINVFLTVDNYILIKYDKFKDLELINYQNFKSIIISPLNEEKPDIIFFMFDLVLEIILKYEELFKNYITLKKEESIILPLSKIEEENYKTENQREIKEINQILCEKIWGIFVLEKEPCYVYSIIENKKRFFKYYVNINNKINFFNNIFDMIIFLQKNFYKVIKECTLLVQ